MYTQNQIIEAINAYMRQTGGNNIDWYVGITSNIDERLFNAHGVSRTGNAWIYRRAKTDHDARTVEAAYHRAGCKGAGGGGDHTAVFVYAYRITSQTRE